MTIHVVVPYIERSTLGVIAGTDSRVSIVGSDKTKEEEKSIIGKNYLAMLIGVINGHPDDTIGERIRKLVPNPAQEGTILKKDWQSNMQGQINLLRINQGAIVLETADKDNRRFRNIWTYESDSPNTLLRSFYWPFDFKPEALDLPKINSRQDAIFYVRNKLSARYIEKDTGVFGYDPGEPFLYDITLEGIMQLKRHIRN